MYELIPLLGGVVLGVLALGLGSARGRSALVGAGGLALGVTAAVASGEIAESWLFVVWDTAQAVAAGGLSLALATRLRRDRTGYAGRP